MAGNPNGDDRPNLLLVDDDAALCEALARALGARGFHVRIAHTADAASADARASPPEYAVIDLNLPGGSGLRLVPELMGLDPNTRVVVFTGFGSIATAVEAIKLGATHYLTKPANADEVARALHRDQGDENVPSPEKPMSVERLEWEHISRVLADCSGNISQAARALSMHRRTLQRKLAKRPNRE
jgi:two-component system response regulator RegA